MFGKYPSLFLLLFIIPAIVVTDMLLLPAVALFPAATVATLVGILLIKRLGAGWAALCLGLAIGLMAGAHFSIKYVSVGPSHISRLVSSPERRHIFGVVSDWPDIRADRTELTIALDSLGDLAGVNRPVGGGILVKVTDTSTGLQRGDRVEFFGRIYPLSWQDATDRLDYRRRLHLRGVSAIVYLPTLLDVRIDRRYPWGLLSFADRVHDAIVGAINADLPSGTGALASGFLIGETRGIPIDVYQRFRDSGTLHVLAVSGGNVALVCLFILIILRPFGAVGRTRSLILLVVVVLFAWICYAEPSVVRASVMATLVLLAKMLQRKIDLHNIIALTAVLILLYDPSQLFDVGAQLSFASAWGLILFMPHVAAKFEPVQHRWWYRFLLFPILVSLVAQLCSTPLIAYYFGKVPVMSVIANLVVVPVAAVATLGTLAMLTAHLFIPMLGAFVGTLLHPLLAALLYCMKVFGSNSFPQIDFSAWLRGPLAGAVVGSLYLVIVLFAWSLTYKLARRLCAYVTIILLNLLLVGFVAEASAYEHDQLHVATVPGGIVATVVEAGRPVDMVITGLSGKTYELDSRILLPLLKTQHVEKVARLFVLAADYAALDDLLRFAENTHVETLFVESKLLSSLHEAASIVPSAQGIVIQGFGGNAKTAAQSIRADEQGVRFPLKGETILVSRTLPDLTTPQNPTIWIYGRTWRPGPDEWAAYRRAGINRIISAKVEQALPEDETMRTADLVLPETIIDLTRESRITLSLDTP